MKAYVGLYLVSKGI